MSRSAASERLLELARGIAAEQNASGALAVAVTGSVARGDADDGSDLDVWVVAEGPAHVERFSRHGVPVTVFREPVELLADVAHLANLDVSETLVLSDPRGVFAACLQQARALDAEVVAYALPVLEQSVAHLQQASSTGSAAGRLLTLRELADRWMTLELMRGHRKRSWKLRHVEQLLGDRPARLLRGVHGLPVPPHILAGLAEAAESVGEDIEAHLRAVGSAHVPSRRPDSALKRIATGNGDESVRQLRKWLAVDFLRPVQRAVGPIHVQRYIAQSAPMRIAAFWNAAHGVGGADSEVEQLAAAARAAVEELTGLTLRRSE